MNYEDFDIKEKDLKKNKIQFQVLQVLVDGKPKYAKVVIERRVPFTPFWMRGKDLTDILQCQELKIKAKEKELEFEKEKLKSLEKTLDILVAEYSAKSMVFGEVIGSKGNSKSPFVVGDGEDKPKPKKETISLVQGKFQGNQQQGNQKQKNNGNNQNNQNNQNNN